MHAAQRAFDITGESDARLFVDDALRSQHTDSGERLAAVGNVIVRNSRQRQAQEQRAPSPCIDDDVAIARREWFVPRRELFLNLGELRRVERG